MKYSDFLAKDRPCPFDKPLDQERILENKHAFLTYALAPYHPDHLLVIPKRHVLKISDITDKEMQDIDDLEKKGWEILRKLGYRSVSLVVREGTDSGRTVDHIHYHIIPDIRIGDIDHNGDARRIMTVEETAETITRIKKVLSDSLSE